MNEQQVKEYGLRVAEAVRAQCAGVAEANIDMYDDDSRPYCELQEASNSIRDIDLDAIVDAIQPQARSYPDFRPQLSKLHQAVEAFEKAFDTGYSDKEWEAVLAANHEAWIALCMDAHDAAVRSKGKATQPAPVNQQMLADDDILRMVKCYSREECHIRVYSFNKREFLQVARRIIAIAAAESVQARRECGCGWQGSQDDCVWCGSVGPLCPKCHETTEAAQAQQPAVYPKYDVFSQDDGDSWEEHTASDCFVHGRKLGDTFELLAGWTADRVTFRVTKVPDDESDDYEVEQVTPQPTAQQPADGVVLDAERLAKALSAVISGCEYSTIMGNSGWHRISFPTASALDQARDALAAHKAQEGGR